MSTTKGFVVPAGGGKHLDMTAPGRFAALKLLGHETKESIMLFEETVPVGTESLFHLHRDSDEVAWVLAGEITFKIGDDVSVGGPGICAFFPRNVPHAWKNTGSETGRVLFLYTPAAAGGYVEELLKRPGPINDDARNTLRERYRRNSSVLTRFEGRRCSERSRCRKGHAIRVYLYQLYISSYEMRLAIDPLAGASSRLTISIIYDLPGSPLWRMIARTLAGPYSRWCLHQMAGERQGSA
jgi:quercetin dioxygenase-like cupin family protein